MSAARNPALMAAIRTAVEQHKPFVQPRVVQS